MSFTRNSSPAMMRSRPPQSQQANGDRQRHRPPAVVAFRTAGDFQDLQFGAFHRGALRADIEAEPQGVGQYRRQLAHLEPHAQHTGAGGPFGARSTTSVGDAEFVHVSADPRQLLARPAYRRCARRRTRFPAPPFRPVRVVISPMIAASRAGRVGAHRGQDTIGVLVPAPPRPACPRWPDRADRAQGFRRRRAPFPESADRVPGCGCRHREAWANSSSTVATPPRVASRRQRIPGQAASIAATRPSSG